MSELFTLKYIFGANFCKLKIKRIKIIKICVAYNFAEGRLVQRTFCFEKSSVHRTFSLAEHWALSISGRLWLISACPYSNYLFQAPELQVVLWSVFSSE